MRRERGGGEVWKTEILVQHNTTLIHEWSPATGDEDYHTLERT